MAIHGLNSAPSPETRHVRWKEIQVVDQDADWPLAIRAALEAAGYRVRLPMDPGDAPRTLGRGKFDLLVISDLIGDPALGNLLGELRARSVPPPTVLLASLHGEKRWEAWRSLPCVSVVRPPFTIEDVLEAVRALIGEPWEDLGGAQAG